MNATKRKLDAILQRIGTRSSTAVSDDDDINSFGRPASGDAAAAAAAAASSSTTATADAMAFESELFAKRRRLAAGAAGSSTTTTTAAIPNVVLKRWNPSGGVTSSASQSSFGSTSTAAATRAIGCSAASAGNASSSPPRREPARYSPGDRAELVRRLGTFQELTEWTPKPERVSEVEWAKRGWVCVGKERVRCTLCAREVVVRLNRKPHQPQDEEAKKSGEGMGTTAGRGEVGNGTDAQTPQQLKDEKEKREATTMALASDVAGALVDSFADLMVTGHAEDCLWKKRACDDSLLRLPLTNAKASLDSLRQRYDELCARAEFLPLEGKLRLPASLDLDAVLSCLPSNFFTSPATPANQSDKENRPQPSSTKDAAPPPPPNRVAFAMALLGWQGYVNARLGAVPNSASCHTCLRRLGLWMFRRAEDEGPSGNNSATITPGGGSSSRRPRAPPMSHLDPLREHRFFCPWRSGAAQRNPGNTGVGSRSRGATTTSSSTTTTSGVGESSPPEDAPPAAWAVLVSVLRHDAHLRGVEAGRRRPATAAGTTAPNTPTPASSSRHGRTASRVADALRRARSRSRPRTAVAAGAGVGEPAPPGGAAAVDGGGGTPGTQPELRLFGPSSGDGDLLLDAASSSGPPTGSLTDDGTGFAFGEDEDPAAKAARDERDRERWVRLRRVKSLFDTKAGKKLLRRSVHGATSSIAGLARGGGSSSSRPGTSGTMVGVDAGESRPDTAAGGGEEVGGTATPLTVPATPNS